ncbi:MAG: hypothetical protein COT73_06675, partial [Bdellovibrio sp. CG10_big_fil_rev_8_21_14_0_10_47_8]
FKILAAAALCSTLMACASSPRHSYTPNTVPETEAQKLNTQLQDLRKQQLDVMSPDHYRKAEKALNQANNEIKDQKDRTDILNHLQIAHDEMERARNTGNEWKSELAPVTAARQKVLDAGVTDQSRPKLSVIDKDLKDITEEKIEPGHYTEEISQLQRRYMDLEYKSIQEHQLQGARDMIKTAKDEGAKKYAAKTLIEAETNMLSAERQIEANRNQPELFKDSVNLAKNSARELLAITLASKDAKGKTPEQIALAARAKEKELAAMDMKNTAIQSRVTELRQETSSQDAALSKQSKALDQQSYALAATQAVNAGLASQVEQDAKLKEIENRFSKQEALVYRQGDSVVIRLKNIRFSTSKADLPAASLTTLSKVKDALTDLSAEKVIVEGHTDSVGTKEINQQISEKRAEAVSKYLTAQGVPASEIQTVGYGFEKPLMSNKTKEGRATNRRVDIVITPASVTE